MKNLKKLVAIVLTLAMLISTLAVSVSAVGYSDVDKSSSYAEAVDILSGLKILQGDEQGNFNPDAEIKRSEFAAVVCRALGQENSANGAKGFTKFADVSVDHWAVGYINWAAQQKIVNGRDANTFDPDAPVQYQEAVKMLVAALGYEPLATLRGGYPTGYLVVAASNNITTGVSMAGNAFAPRSAVAQLTYNALDVPLMDASYITLSGDDEYAIYDGRKEERRTILSHHLNVAKIKADVVETHKSKSSLLTRGGDPKVELKIVNIYSHEAEDVSYLMAGQPGSVGSIVTPYIGNTNADAYLGYTVIAYVGENEDGDAVVYALSPDLKSNDIVEITKDIEAINVTEVVVGDKKNRTVSYWENMDTDRSMTDLDIANGATVYINGEKAYTENAENVADLQTEFRGAAKIVMMAPKNTDLYNKIFITLYKYAIVDAVSLDEEYIKVKAGSAVELSKDVQGSNFVYTITLDGEIIGLEDLEENDVLNLAWSGGEEDLGKNTFVDIIVSRKTVTGTVNETKGSGNDAEYGIDNVYYRRAPGSKNIQMGDSGVFYLTIDDKIIDMQVESTISNNYAFITQYDSETRFGENAYSMKLFTKDGDLVVYPVNTSNFRVTEYATDGTRTTENYGANRTKKQTEFFGTKTEILDGDGKGTGRYEFTGGILSAWVYDKTNAHVEERFVTYKVSNGELTEIELSSVSTSRDVFNRSKTATYSYSASTNRFANYKITGNSKLFYIPISEETNGDIYVNEDQIELRSFSSLDEDEPYAGSFVVNVDGDRNFGAAVLTDIPGFGGRGDGLAVVQSRSKGLDADGNEADRLTLIQAGKEVNLAVSSDAKFVSGGKNDLDKTVTFGKDSQGNDIKYTEASNLGKGDIVLYTLNGKNEISQVYVIYNADKRMITDQLAAVGVDGKMSDKVSIAFGIATATGNDITLSNKRLEGTKQLIAGFDQRDGSTIALYDENKKSSSNGFITSYRDFSSLRASSEATGNTARKYLTVLKLDRNDVTDAVSIAVLDGTTDADIDAPALTFVGLN